MRGRIESEVVKFGALRASYKNCWVYLYVPFPGASVFTTNGYTNLVNDECGLKRKSQAGIIRNLDGTLLHVFGWKKFVVEGLLGHLFLE